MLCTLHPFAPQPYFSNLQKLETCEPLVAVGKHILYGVPPVIAALLRLLALRPFLTMGIVGFPVLLLIAIGLVTIFALKALVFIVIPAAIVIWLVRKAYQSAKAREMFEGGSSI